nr:unnamed protein product [Spirometra erinaceieuropaei]
MLGIRAALKPVLECSAAELVYGTTLRIPASSTTVVAAAATTTITTTSTTTSTIIIVITNTTELELISASTPDTMN